MTLNETTLRNARIVVPGRVITGSVCIRDGLIASIDEGDSVGGAGIDLAGDDLLPGVVEVHTDQVETHHQPRPGRVWDPLAAVIAHDAQMAASGITTVFDALRIGTDFDAQSDAAATLTIIEALDAATKSSLLRADHLVHLRCEVSTSDVVDVFDELASGFRVRMISLMDHTPGERQYANIDVYRSSLMAQRRGIDESAFDERLAKQQAHSAQYATANRIALAERAGRLGVVTATHDDATPEHVAESAALGVSISEFPTTIAAAQAAREASQRIVMGAPNLVRGGSHSGNVAALELLELGLLDILSSDYVPASPLQAVYLLAARGIASLSEAIELVSSNPAQAMGLNDRGTIEVGKRADLVRVAPHTPEGADPLPIVRSVWRAGERVA